MEGGAEETGREDIGMRRMKDDVGKETGKGRGGRESLLRDQIDKNASSLFLKKKKKKTMIGPLPQHRTSSLSLSEPEQNSQLPTVTQNT